MQRWEEMLDEYALHPEGMPWFHVSSSGLRMRVSEQFDAVQECVSRGYLVWAGVACRQWKESIYQITPAGRAYWEQNIKGKRKRPTSADPIPRWSTAQRAAAESPVSVWDLARVPFLWDKKSEQGIAAADDD